MTLAMNGQKDFIEVPFVSWLGASTLQPIRVVLPKLQTPLADGFMGDVHPAFEQQFLHVAVAQREAIIEPDAMADDLTGEAVVLVAFRVSGWRLYRWILLRLAWFVRGHLRRSLCHGRGRMVNNLTMPAGPSKCEAE